MDYTINLSRRHTLTVSLSETHIIIVFLHDGFVEADGLLVLVLLHEEHVGHVQLPGVMVVAHLHRLVEDFLHHLVVLPVPIDLSLGHEHWDVPGVRREQPGFGSVGGPDRATKKILPQLLNK